MKEATERTVKVGFTRSPKKIFDEVERISAEMARDGWGLKDWVLESGLGNIHLFFERGLADMAQESGGGSGEV